MTTAVLVAYTEGRDDSEVTTIADGSFHTIIPIFKGRPGKVTVSVVNSDDSTQLVATLSSNPRHPNEWQLRGPLEYVVSVRNAGADFDDGTA